MENYEIAHNDFGYDLNFTVTKADGSARNLTGLDTVKLKTWLPGSPGSPKINDDCIVDNAAGGLCHYTLKDGDTDLLGTFIAELEGTAAGLQDTLGQFEITVKESG